MGFSSGENIHETCLLSINLWASRGPNYIGEIPASLCFHSILTSWQNCHVGLHKIRGILAFKANYWTCDYCWWNKRLKCGTDRGKHAQNIPQLGTVWSSWRKRGIEKPRAQTNGAVLTTGPPRGHRNEDPSNPTKAAHLLRVTTLPLLAVT